MTRAIVIVAAMAAAGCAQRPAPAVSRSDVSPAADGAALIRSGCYRCLERAYEAARGRDDRLAFEAAALLVLRSKELGLAYDRWLRAARALAGGGDAPVLAMVEAIPPHPLSGDPDGVMNLSGRIQARTSLEPWRESLRTGPWSGVFRAYLDVALICAFGRVVEDERSFTGPLDLVAQAPIYQYRLGICDSAQAARLAGFRERHPDFVEADLPLGTYALENPVNPDYEEGLRRLRSAAEAFPDSPAIAATIGDVYRSWEEWGSALEAYDRALAIAPDHPEALIGRTISLSRMDRPGEAIETATRVIDGGRWRLGEAYYWRGWNRLVRAEYPLARDDADRAKKLMANAPVFVLSGVIDRRLGRLESAERDFEQALLMDLGECEAAANLGMVRGERGKVAEASAAFAQARQCYDLSIALREEAIAKVRSGGGHEATKARAIAIHERWLVDFRDRREAVLRSLDALQKRSSSGFC